MFSNNRSPYNSNNHGGQRNQECAEKEKIRVVIQNSCQKITGDIYLNCEIRFQEQINRMYGNLDKCFIPMTSVTIEEAGQPKITVPLLLNDIRHAYWVMPVEETNSNNQGKKQNSEQVTKNKIKVVIQNPRQKITGEMYLYPKIDFQKQINLMRSNPEKYLVPMTNVTIEETGVKPILAPFILFDISRAFWIIPVQENNNLIA